VTIRTTVEADLDTILALIEQQSVKLLETLLVRQPADLAKVAVRQRSALAKGRQPYAGGCQRG